MSLKVARERAGMTADAVASRIGVSKQAVYQWESGRFSPRLDKLVQLAELYGVTVDDLLRKEDADGPRAPD